MPACHAGGHGFESRTHRQSLPRCVSSAWLECLPVTQEVTGSSPVRTAERDPRVSFFAFGASSLSPRSLLRSGFFLRFALKALRDYESRTHRRKRPSGLFFVFGASSLSPRSLLSSCYTYVAYGTYKPYEKAFQPHPSGRGGVIWPILVAPHNPPKGGKAYMANMSYGKYKDL